MLGYRIAKRIFLGLSVSVSALVGVTTLSGCADLLAPQASQDRYPILDSSSAFNTEKTHWHKPFWQRFTNPLGATQDTAPQATPSTANTGAGATTTVAVANPPASTAVAAQPPATSKPTAKPVTPADTLLRPQIGVYLDGASGDSKASYQLVNALEAHASEYGMTVLKPGALTDALGDASTCADPASIRCRQTLAIYPGVRALLIITVQPADAGGQAQVKTRMADTDFGVDYDPSTANVSLQDNDLALWSQRVLDRTAGRLSIAPWFTHSFARQGDSVYVSAGPRSGLEAGTTLATHGEGAIVRAPGGSVVGWNPGPVVGRLKVKSPIGKGASLAELISGQMPTPGDRLTVVRKEDVTTGRQ